MKKDNDFWLIDSNSVGVIRFYKKSENKEDLIEYIFIFNFFLITHFK